MGIAAAVIGAGRMGSVVARQLPRGNRTVIIDLDQEKAKQLSQEVNGVFAASLQGAQDADVVFIILPAPAVKETTDALLGIVKNGAVLVNMATNVYADKIYQKNNRGIKLIDAKIIGHSSAISKEEKGLVIIKTEDAGVFNLIRELLAELFTVEQGDADIVETVNSIAVVEGIKTVISLRKQFMEREVPEKWGNAVITSVCLTTMKAYLSGALGPFAAEIAKKLESDGA